MGKILNVEEAAEFARCHPETIRDALRGGELRGGQRRKRGIWHTTEEYVTNWLLGEAKAA